MYLYLDNGYLRAGKESGYRAKDRKQEMHDTNARVEIKIAVRQDKGKLE